MVALTMGQGGYHNSQVGTLRLRESEGLVPLQTAEACGQDQSWVPGPQAHPFSPASWLLDFAVTHIWKVRDPLSGIPTVLRPHGPFPVPR